MGWGVGWVGGGDVYFVFVIIKQVGVNWCFCESVMLLGYGCDVLVMCGVVDSLVLVVWLWFRRWVNGLYVLDV